MKIHSDTLAGLVECLRPVSKGRMSTFYNALITEKALVTTNGLMIAVAPLEGVTLRELNREVNGIDLSQLARMYPKNVPIALSVEGDGSKKDGERLVAWDAKNREGVPLAVRLLPFQAKGTVPTNILDIIASAPKLGGVLGTPRSIDVASMGRAARAFARYRSVAIHPQLYREQPTWMSAGFTEFSTLSILFLRVGDAIPVGGNL